MVRIATLTGLLLLALLMAASGAWATLALAIAGPHVAWMRIGPAVLAGLATVAFLAAPYDSAMALEGRRGLGAPDGRRAGLVVRLKPSNDRDWLPNVARTPWATVAGDTVTVHNIRNFTYRTETDFTPAWYDKSYDLRKLEGIDIVASYWMGPDIAHVFVSFAFAGGDHLAMSIETRTEKGEGYSAIKGFFRQYELYYVVADERDVIGLRTNYRSDPPEDVYVYRIKSNPEGRRAFFLEYVRQINALKDHPEFYNSLTTNCTTNIWTQQPRQSGPPPIELEDPCQRPCPGIPVSKTDAWKTLARLLPTSSGEPMSTPGRKPLASCPTFSQRIRKPE